MIKTLKLNDIIRSWQDALQSSTYLREFCISKYKKTPRIIDGTNVKNVLHNMEYPQIILYPGARQDGAGAKEHIYKLAIKWTILQSKSIKMGGMTSYSGVAESDELGQLIYMELASLTANSKISSVSYKLEPSICFPRFPGWMNITLKIAPEIKL